MGSYFWEQYHFDYIFEILIRENARFGTPPRILLSITDPTQNWLLAPAPPSVETPGTGWRREKTSILWVRFYALFYPKLMLNGMVQYGTDWFCLVTVSSPQLDFGN